ncbi:hypothetical protein Hanom_Chr14g01284231 [Helianthus anomalus]
MLPNNHDQQQRKRKNLLDPPRNLLHIRFNYQVLHLVSASFDFGWSNLFGGKGFGYYRGKEAMKYL